MRTTITGLTLLLLAAAAVAAAEPLKVGDTAPDFTLLDQDGEEIRLKDFRGKRNVVLAFFPKAFTGG